MPLAKPITKRTHQSPLIALNNVGIYRDGRWLVRNIDFEVMAGEIVTLIGPNGSGKSISVKLALGISKPDEGQVIKQQDLKVGYVPQKLHLDWSLPLSVGRFMRLTRSMSESKVMAALRRTHSEHLVDAQMRKLSGGEMQRVLLARAMALAPDILVLDEPVQGVDFAGEIALYQLIQAFREETGCAVLLVSHDLHLVMAATDKVICLNGHVCCSGTPVSVAKSEPYKRLFGAQAALTHAVYEHAHDHTHLPDGRVMHRDGTTTEHCHPDDGHHHHENHRTVTEKESNPNNKKAGV